MGINRWSGGTEDRKREEAEAKAGDQVPKDEKGDDSSRLEASKEASEDPEKRRVVEKLEDREEEHS